ncbi:hypothetical protein KEJ37_00420 [Candidatus Bathyarchaeota archaeon]|nr:hypothetical protein [Candidatus Bathyarchaeota archaeon]
MPSYGEQLSDSFFIEEATKILNEARKRNIVLRVIGALAVKLHSPGYEDLYAKLKRLGENNPTFTDIDFVAYGKQRKELVKLFNEMRYIPDMYIMAFFGSKRLLYYHPQRLYHVDIFLDKLEFSHEIFFGNEPGKGRLEIEEFTISLADLVLEKVQIHEINEKDIKDLIILFSAHNLAETDKPEAINIKYVAKVLAGDWGFWFDAKENLKKVLVFAKKYHEEGLITATIFEDVNRKIGQLLTAIDQEPKTKAWEKRAKIGTNKKWYRDVEELVR